jgi:hypothetical protein
MFKLSINKCYNEYLKSIEQILSCSSINQKRMQDYFDIQELYTFIWSAKPY